jgi:hypothetical protein
MLVGMEERTLRDEDESRMVHLHSADVDNVVEIEPEAVGVIY